MREAGHGTLECPRCGYKAGRDTVGGRERRKRVLRKLGILQGGPLTLPNCPQMTDVASKEWGNQRAALRRGTLTPSRAGRRLELDLGLAYV